MLTMKRPDVIYANTWPIIATGILFLVARLRGIALVISIQDVYPEALVVQRRIRDDGLLARFMRWIDGCIARHSAHVIVISERFAEVYRDQRGVPADRVHVIPNWGDERAVTSDSGGAQLRAEMGIPPDAFLMVYGGNVGVAAGLEGVIQALDNWPLDTPRPYLLVAGAGASLDACRTLAARVAGDHIRFLTPWPTEKTGPVHSAADILVLPTQGAQSMVSVPSKLISYMLSGRPVIAQAIPGSDLARTVEDSRCGWVVEPGSPEVLATTIREVMALPEIERVQRGEAGRAFACHYLTRAACLPQVVRVLEQAASTEVQQDARV
jgi:glycosyltransferase involved in cell wall biosynthesis